MKLDFIEVSGFRGFRDRIRVDLPAGFVVVSGRNGSGKSSLCDAIDFALTGTINKYRVDRAAKETLDDYLWWRGRGKVRAHYVSLGFSDEGGSNFEIRRSRDEGLSVPTEELEALLCFEKAKPEEALRQICQTTIIRDELIAALSLDLTETERLAFVSSALGAIDAPDYEAKVAEATKSAQTAQQRVSRHYDELRDQLNQVIVELGHARDSALEAQDLSSAIETLRIHLSTLPAEMSDQIRAAREVLADRRTRLSSAVALMEEATSLATEISVIRSDEFKNEIERAHSRVSELLSEQAGVGAEIAQAQKDLEEENRLGGSDLAALLHHGSQVGLIDGHCPLCNKVQEASEFEAGLDALRNRLDEAGRKIADKEKDGVPPV